VLDALGTHIPIPLWEAASRTPQPADGHLPDTGVLSSLQTASKNKEFGHTVLLAMKALGPAGAEGAHMIALGDSIRALRRAGLEKEARELGLEALFASWPRVTSY
jgi:LmbE family N-acetylglucosaminyl deacetylase